MHRVHGERGEERTGLMKDRKESAESKCRCAQGAGNAASKCSPHTPPRASRCPSPRRPGAGSPEGRQPEPQSRLLIHSHYPTSYPQGATLRDLCISPFASPPMDNSAAVTSL
jgi:hypothetical protein